VRRLLWGQFRHRPGRSAALALAILVAAVSFTLLTASASTSALHVHGTLKSSFRPAYDILVRPANASTGLEQSERLVRPNFLSGVYGGITLKQWHAIADTRGVAVAAPSANLGYGIFYVKVPFSIRGIVNRSAEQLYHQTYAYVTNDGHSRYEGAANTYVFYHPGKLSPRTLALRQKPCCGDPTGEPLICASGLAGAAPSPPLYPSPFRVWPGFACSEQPGTSTESYILVDVPIKLAAIDPASEAKLLRLDHAVIAGRYLRERDPVKLVPSNFGSLRAVPVIASSRLFLGEQPIVNIDRLMIPPGLPFDRLMATGACLEAAEPCPAREPPLKGYPWKTAYAFVKSLSQRRVATETFPVAKPYHDLIANGDGSGSGLLGLHSYWQDSPVRYQTLGPDHLEPVVVKNPYSIWQGPPGNGYLEAPPENQDTQFRRLRQAFGSESSNQSGIFGAPFLRVVGRYDPNMLPGFSPLSRVPLETYYPPELEPADAQSTRVLHGQPLLPTQNLGDYIAQPPLLLTTLNALTTLLSPKAYSGLPASERAAPLAAIRVKVAGVTGPDQLSLERIKVVAQRIHAATGLTVDITAGSSPHPVLITLPNGKFGRPQLLLREGWSKKGVTVSFLRALDRKDVALFALILVVCAFFLGNGAFASVRARRSEIGALLTLGWSPGEVFRAVLGELLLVGAFAGVAGAVLAATLVASFSLHLPLLRTLLVVPIAVMLALVAGFFPAWSAARVRPLEAIRPPVVGGGRGRHVRGIPTIALVNLGRLPGRTLIGAAGLMLGVAALTILVAIERGFQGTLIGTVLGSAISLQVRGADFVALGLTLALAALSAGDVLYLNLRERQAEIVTLKTLGWSDSETRRLVAIEAVLLAMGASVAGALLGVLVGALMLGVGVKILLIAAAIAAAAAVGAASVSSLLPLLRIRSLSAPEVLAAE
jgi:putative ABC transport system permease protein